MHNYVWGYTEILPRPFPWIDDGPSSLTFDFRTIRLKVREVGY